MTNDPMVLASVFCLGCEIVLMSISKNRLISKQWKHHTTQLRFYIAGVPVNKKEKRINEEYEKSKLAQIPKPGSLKTLSHVTNPQTHDRNLPNMIGHIY